MNSHIDVLSTNTPTRENGSYSTFRGDTSSLHWNVSKFDMEPRVSPLAATILGLALSGKLARLLERERVKSCDTRPEREDCEDEDEARRCRMRFAGSTSRMLAITANSESMSTMETIPHRLPVVETG